MNRTLIKQLTDLNGVSSYEGKVKQFLKNEFKDASAIIEDNLGGICAVYDSGKPGPNILVLAHMDEVGFMVKNILDNGIVKLMPIGGLSVDSLISQRIVITNDENQEFEGVILGIAPHLATDTKKNDVSQLDVDFGFDTKEEVLAANIQLGDMVTFKNDFQILNDRRIVAKALDNRLGCAAVSKLARTDKSEICKNGKLFLGASVQEEVGLRGAPTIANAIKKKIDWVVVVDVSPVDDIEKVENGKVGGGALIRVKDPRCILDPKEVRLLQQLAKQKEITAQNYFSKGGTDAAAIQITKDGFKTCAVCVPSRNIHTNNVLADLGDFESSVDLIIAYIESKQENYGKMD